MTDRNNLGTNYDYRRFSVSTKSIRDDATTLLIRFSQLQTHPNFRTEYIDGSDLVKLLAVGPARLSDAVAFDADVAKAQQKYAGMPFEMTIDRIEPERLFAFRWRSVPRRRHERGE